MGGHGDRTLMTRETVLRRLDRERQRMGASSTTGDVRVEFSDDASCCAVVHSALTSRSADAAIRDAKAGADARGYSIDWKVYGHDQPSDLRQRLVAAGFAPEPQEQVLALPLDQAAIARFPQSLARLERVHDATGLTDVEDISREIGRNGVTQEKEHFARLLEERPDHMSIFVAYDGDTPVSCGRIYYYEVGDFAELCGGRTKTAFRRRGLYLALVWARLAEAAQRGFSCVTVDALPTSAPLLRRRGFEPVTWTQPLIYQPDGRA